MIFGGLLDGSRGGVKRNIKTFLMDAEVVVGW